MKMGEEMFSSVEYSVRFQMACEYGLETRRFGLRAVTELWFRHESRKLTISSFWTRILFDFGVGCGLCYRRHFKLHAANSVE